MIINKSAFLWKLLFTCLLWHCAFNANATTEQVAGLQFTKTSAFSVSSNASASSDFLVINSDSETVQLAFERFEVTNKPLLIKLANTSKIKTLVIKARYFSLREKISVVGKPVNIMFVSSYGTLTCTSCSFENVERITLVNGTYGYGSSSSHDKITTRASGRVTINGLSAPGAHSLEVMADRISTSGTIDLNLRAQRHPQGGFIFAENGRYVLGSGGVNLYPGLMTIKYSDLDIQEVSQKNEVYQPYGTFKAASIGIVASQPITIPGSTEFNTMSDALATSTRQGHFRAPAEGVFIQIAKNESAPLAVHGKLYSDRIITTKTMSSTTFNTGARIIAQTVKVFGKNHIFNHGYIDADKIKIGADRLINTGTLNGSEVNIETDGDVHNTFGGVIKAGNLSAVLTNGMFTNGSRTNRSNRSVIMPLIAPSIRIDSTNHGPYSTYSQAGDVQSRVSAKIHANTVKIVAKAIENINPYHIAEPQGADWSEGISVNTVKADQVSIAAESSLELKADNYIRNTSAILRLNQQGIFHVDTPLMFNERYRLETTSYIISRYAYTADNKGSRDVVEHGVGTQISAYSPPGRVISFGQFEIGSKVAPSTRRRFVNAFSYVEIFDNVRLQKLDLESTGIKLSSTVAKENIYSMKQCIALGNCSGSTIKTSVEGETLLSIHGNVYGINPNVASDSDLTQTDSDSLDATINDKIKEYFQRYVSSTDEDTYSGYYQPKVINDTSVKAGLYNCDGYRYEEHGLTRVNDCSYGTVTVELSKILGETSTADFANTGYTFKQVNDAGEKYARNNQPATTKEDYRCNYNASVRQYECTTKNFEYEKILVDEETQQATIHYTYDILIENQCDVCDDKFFTRHIAKSPTISVTTLMAGN